MASVRSVHRTSTNVHRFGEKHFLNGCDRHIACTADVEHDLPVARANRPVGERAALTFERRKLAQLLLHLAVRAVDQPQAAVACDDVDAGTSAQRIPAESALRERLLPPRGIL
jgi:methylaspartate ammonia-lyase